MRRVQLSLSFSFAFLIACQTSAAPADSGPEISFSPPSLQFLQQAVGTTKTGDVLIENTGTSTLHIMSASVDNPLFTVSGCPSSSPGDLPPFTNCNLYVEFAPTVAGSFNATVSVFDDAPDSPQTIPITATATGIELQPTRLKFHLVEPGNISPPKSISVTNTGGVPIAISNFATTGTSGAEYLIQSNTCPQVLMPAAACAVGIAFAPTALAKAEAALTITDDDAESPQKAILLGDGTDILMSPITVNFGKRGLDSLSPPVPITITNTGSIDVTITGIAINNFHEEDPFGIDTNNCPAVLKAGASCVVQVVFEPEQKGQMVGQLVVTDSEAGSPQTSQLSGTGEF